MIRWIFCVALLFLTVLQANALTTYTVGAGGTHTTIASAYAACTAADVYIIEVRSDYTQEALPITLGSLTNKSAVNTVTIRPASGVAGLSLANTVANEADIFRLNSASYVIFDGRPGGAGGGDFTVSNNQTAQGHAIKLYGSCDYVTFQYMTLKGSNQATGVGSADSDAGVLVIGESGAGNFSNITVNYCTITKGTGGTPTYLFCSFSSTGSITSSTISNCNFVDASSRFVCFSTGSTGWTVSGSHFYQTAAVTPDVTNPFTFIRVVAGGGYTFTGNYMGGQATSCGGAAFTINTAAVQHHYISFSSSASGTNVIQNNTFQNISETTTYGTSPAIAFIYIAGGSATYTVGSSGNGNTFGATAGTGSITITDNGGASTAAISVLYADGSGTVNMTYNSIGALTLGGSNTGGRVMSFYTTSTVVMNFSYNTVGNATANNLSDGLATRVAGFYLGGRHSSSAAVTCSNNTFRNLNVTSTTTEDIYGLYSTTASSVVFSSNTFSTITSAAADDFNGLYATIAGDVTANSNSISSITLSETTASRFYGLYITSSAGNVTCSSNAIGSTTGNNLTVAGNTVSYGVYITVPTTKTAVVSSNFVRQFNGTSTSTAAGFYGIRVGGAGTTIVQYNQITDITLATTYPSGTFAFIGISLATTGSNNILLRNMVDNIVLSTTSAVTCTMTGIYISGPASGNVIRKNLLKNFENKATGSCNMYGIYHSSSTSTSFYNNVIMLSNGANTNTLSLYGFSNWSAGTTNFYHNTVKLGGSIGAGAYFSYSIQDGAAAASVRNYYNNIFYNNRSGGTGSHRAMTFTNTSGVSIDYNYLESTSNPVYWSGSSYSFAAWQAIPMGANDKNGTLTFDANGAVTAGSAGTVANTGTDMDATVSDDYDGNSRHATTPWRGAFEGAVSLPVSLVFFKAVKKGSEVDLLWETATEYNNSHFLIEKTKNGVDFEFVDLIQGNGNSIYTTEYITTDRQPFDGISYYRLTQVDLNGYEEIYPLVSVDFESSGELVLYPNPLRKNALVSVVVPENWNFKPVNLEMYDNKGILVYKEFIQELYGNSVLVIRLPQEIMEGRYLIRLTQEGQSSLQRDLIVVD